MKKPEEPRHIPWVVADIKEEMSERVSSLVDNFIKELEQKLNIWEKYSEELKEYYEDIIWEKEEEIKELKGE